MDIVYNSRFIRHFSHIWDYISDDNVPVANRLKKKLQRKLEQLKNFPYKYRSSFYYEDEQIRDYVFKGYTIPYLIDEQKNCIVILDIFKWTDH